VEVRIYPNSARPGVGQRPRREGQRPLLPQHARHCPVLEAGSALGFMVYPALEPNESFHVEFQGEGQYRFVYMLAKPGGHWEGIFSISITLPIGTVGMIKEEVAFASRKPPISKEAALDIMRAFVIREDLGTPPGAIALRGATNFRTPPGWDTVYAPVFNLIDRPVAPALVVRVETDWYAHETEFRYVLQPGEGIPGTHHMPIGQVFFVPREEITMQDCSADEIAAIRKSAQEFFLEKAKHKISTATGLQYSPHYSNKSRLQKKEKT
jgi:hypothetical protein